MRHHEAGRQVVEHGEAAEHRLGRDAERQQKREPTRSRRNGRRVNASTAATTVITPTTPETARLPNSISAWEQRRQRRAAALGPVLAAEPGVGEPYRRARHHDQRQRSQRDVGDAAVLDRGYGETVAHFGEHIVCTVTRS